MKKTIMLFAIILFLGMFSCSKSKTISQVTYGCFITEIANDGIIESPEKDWWQSNESNVDKIKEITIFDKHCMAKYVYSVFVYWGPKIVDCYKSDEDNLMVYLFRDGSFAGFHKFFEKGYYYDDGNLEDSYDYARNLAIKYAKDYIDVEEYVIEEKISDYSLQSDNIKTNLYTFYFVKYIDSFRTSDCLSITITSKGDIRTVNIGCREVFIDYPNISVDNESLTSTIDTKLKESYLKYPYLSYEIERQTLTVTPQGSLAVVSDIHVSVGNSKSDDNIQNTAVILTTILE